MIAGFKWLVIGLLISLWFDSWWLWDLASQSQTVAEDLLNKEVTSPVSALQSCWLEEEGCLLLLFSILLDVFGSLEYAWSCVDWK